MSGFALYTEQDGIYLGNCLGLGFWSKMDPAGQDHAVLFPSEQSALEHVFSWDSAEADIRVRFVASERPDYASVQECVDAGLPWWDPELADMERGEREAKDAEAEGS